MTQETFIHIAGEIRAKAVATARGFGCSQDDAEDVAQDVMLKLWCLHEKLADTAPQSALVAIATRRVCIDKWRGTRGFEKVDMPMTVIDEGSTFDRLEYTELEQWIDEQIEGLPSTTGIVLRMRQIEGRELSEIADILGIKQTSVSTLLSRARKELLNKLKRRNQQ